MPKIIKLSSHVTKRDMEYIKTSLEEMGEEAILVIDDEMQVFEYDDLDEVTINESEIKKTIEEGDEKQNTFLQTESLKNGME